MSSQISEALGQLNVQPGQTYRTTFNGTEFEVRDLGEKHQAESDSETTEFGNMCMLEPWFEMPEPVRIGTVRATLGVLPPIALPVIPPDFEYAE